MAVLRIVTPPPRLKLVDNFPRRNDPYRFTTLRIRNPPPYLLAGKTTKTTALSGTVKNAFGTALPGRMVHVFGDAAMTLRLGVVETNASGEFSITVAGGAAQKFTLITQPELGENGQIFSSVI